MRAGIVCVTAVLIFAGQAGPVGGQPAAVAGPVATAEETVAGAGLEQEVRELNSTLGQLVELLRRQLESSNAAVLMQRVQLMTARIAPLEQELRAARAEQQGHQSSLDDLDLSTTSLEADLDRQVEEERLTVEEARGIMEQQEQVVDQRRKQLEARLWEATQRVIDLEQRLTARRREIETWEGEIDRVLGLR